MIRFGSQMRPLINADTFLSLTAIPRLVLKLGLTLLLQEVIGILQGGGSGVAFWRTHFKLQVTGSVWSRFHVAG